MRVTWFGQSAFLFEGGGTRVFLDPFGVPGEALAARGMTFDYPPIEGIDADLVLVTHEHFDHNAVEAIGGSPVVLRSTAGKLDSPLGEVMAIASEHDARAGTERGPNTIFVFSLDGIRVCHFGDFGQADLRPEQLEAIGHVDLLFLPVGGGPTIDAAKAVEIGDRILPKWVVPMHYRTPAISFLDSADDFIARVPDDRLMRLDEPGFDTDAIGSRAVVVPAPPTR